MKYLIITILFFIPFLCQAESIDIDTGWNGGSGGTQISNLYHYGNTFIPTVNNITGMDITVELTPNIEYELYICKGSPDNTDYEATAHCENNTFVASTTFLSTADFVAPLWENWTHIDLEADLVKNTYHYFTLKTDVDDVYSWNLRTYNNGRFTYIDWEQYPQWDLSFRTYYDESNTDWLNITFPYATSTGWKDFNQWNIQYEYWPIEFIPVWKPLYLQIYYKKVIDSDYYTDLTNVNYTDHPIIWSFKKMNKLSTGSYEAYAKMFVQDYATGIDYLATSSTIYFDIDNVNGEGDIFSYGTLLQKIGSYDIDEACENVPTSSPITWSWDLSVTIDSLGDNLRYGVECGMNKMVYWTFHPSDAVVLELDQATRALTNEFPINIYSSILDNVSLSYENMPTSTLAVNIYAGNLATSSTGIINVLNEDKFSSVFGSENWHNIYEYMNMIIYFMTVLYFIFYFVRTNSDATETGFKFGKSVLGSRKRKQQQKQPIIVQVKNKDFII